MRIEALVSDLGQVLLRFDTGRVWARLLPACSVAEAVVRREHTAALRDLGFEVGAASGEAFHRRLVERCGLRLPYEEFRLAWSDMFWEDAEALRLVRAAAVRRRLLLSNTNCIHWEFITQRYPHVLAPFDPCLVSHECGARKPDAAIYERALAVTGLPPERHLFVDDLEENVRAARALGMDAVLHTDAASLARELAARGLVPPP